MRSQEETTKRLYAQRKSIPWELMDSLIMHSRVLQPQEDVIIEEREVHPHKLLRKYFDEHEGMEERCNSSYNLGEILNTSFEWLITVMSVMCSGKIDKTGKISMKRFMEVLKVLK